MASEQSPNLSLPYILAAQSQKHVTHNEAIRALDALVQLSVLDRDLNAPPGAPADGARYIVGPTPAGSWAGRANCIAAWQDGAWAFYAPGGGWRAWVADEEKLLAFDGVAWNEQGVASLNPAPMIGVNATADGSTRLAVSSPASLFSHEGGGHQVKVNKATGGDSASMLFQTGLSGRAELGTTGDDDWHIKVSADGAIWHEALVVDRMTGAVSFPNTILGGGGGSSTFTGLTDTPAAYTGEAGKLVRVDPGETALTFSHDLPLLGVNGTPDASNRLAVSSPTSLFNHEGAGHQIKVNKASAIETASVLFQDGFSGRAEFGLTGDDDWHVKVSPDGSTWHEAIVVDRATGSVSLPNTAVASGAPLALWDFWTEARLGNVTATSLDAFIGASVSSGTNNTAIPVAAVLGYNSHGVFLRSSTTANGGYRYQTSSLVSDYFGVVSHKFRAKFLWRTSFTDRLVRVGYHDTSTNADAADGAYFEIAGAVCSAKTANNATRTTNTTTVTLSLDVAYTFDIEVNAAGTEARFRVYAGTTETPILDVTNTTNIPTTSARAFGAGIVATEASTTASDIGILYELGMGTFAGFEAAKVPKQGVQGSTGATGPQGDPGPAGAMVHEAARLLGGESGIAFDFAAREASVRDYADVLTASGTPEELLTVSRASEATAIGRSRLMQTAASNVLRYAHMPTTSQPLGALIEGAQTNIATHSGAIDNAAWTKVRCSVTANAAAGPFGTSTLEKLVEDSTSNNSHYAHQAITVVSGTRYHIACFARAAEWPSIAIRFGTGFPSVSGIFNLTTGVASVLGAGAYDEISMIDFGDGLWLCLLVQTATSSTTAEARIHISNGTLSLTGENGTKGVFVGEVSIGEGYPGAYVASGASAATRAADDVIIPVADFPFGVAEGAVFLAARTPRRQDGVPRCLLSIDGGSDTDCIQVYRDASNQIVVEIVVGGVTQASVVAGTVAPDTDFRLGLRYRLNDIAATLDGAAAVSDSSATIPTVGTMRLGRKPSGSEWSSTLRKLAVIDRGLSNSELIARVNAMAA